MGKIPSLFQVAFVFLLSPFALTLFEFSHIFPTSDVMIILPIPSATVMHIFSSRATAQNATMGDSRVGWVSAGSSRSTSDILWSCFSILLVCTWKCVHFNVPSIAESEPRWYRRGILCWPIKRLPLKWTNKAGWMIAIALAPEIGVTIAMDQYLKAREGLSYLTVGKGNSKEDKPKDIELKEPELEEIEVRVDGVGGDEITKTHIFFANMGGLVAKIWVLSRPKQGTTSLEKLPQDEISPDETPSIPNKKSPTMGGFIYFLHDYTDLG